MKISIIAFLYLSSAQCGVLQDDLEKSGTANNADYSLLEVREIRVIDSYENGNITLQNYILINVTKDKESQDIRVETDTSKLPPGLHKWEIQFSSNQHSEEEINHMLGIVEIAANKTGQLVSKTCTTGDFELTCNFMINFDVTNEPNSKIQNNEIGIQNNTQPMDGDETKLEPNETDSALETEMDNQNCDSNREKDQQIATENRVVCREEYADFQGGCPTGTARADDGTCLPVVV